jgi:fatty-acid desaturase
MNTNMIETPTKTGPSTRNARRSFEQQQSDSNRNQEGKPDQEPDWKTVTQSIGPDQLSWKNVDWVIFTWMVAMHAGCLVAPFYFSWSALGVAVVLHWLTCSIGICMTYHRYLAHRSFKLSKPAEFFALLCGLLSGEGTPLMWTATHRMHHQLSDHKGDPHSPLNGQWWWSHMLWTFLRHIPKYQETLYRRYAPELFERPLMRFFEKTYGLWLTASGLAFLALGGLIGGLDGAISMLLWGLCVRMAAAYHTTWLINSATHLWGYRNYETRDESRNLWWVAILAYGEGWHNNHHAHPALAPAGHKWWEIDMTWWSIKFLRFCGLAYDVKDRLPTNSCETTESTVQ